MKFIAEEDALTIKLQGMEMVFSLKRRLVLPRANMVELLWTPEYNFHDLLLRLAGTGVPRVMYAGHFRDVDTKENVFLYLRLPKGLRVNRTMSDANVLAVTMRDYPYGKVFVTCRPDIGQALVKWWKGSMPENA